jgi:nitrogen fixation protein FixH
VVSDGTVGIELNGAAELVIGSGCVPVAVEQGEGQGSVGFGRVIVKFDRPFGRRQRARIGLTGRHDGIFAQQVVAVGEADISRSVVGIVNDGLGEVVDRLV